MEKITWPEKVTNGVFIHIGMKSAFLNNIPCREANWIGHILRKNCLLLDSIEGEVAEVKGVGRRQLLDDLRSRRYWELKEIANDRKKGVQTGYHKNTRKKFKLCSTSPWIC